MTREEELKELAELEELEQLEALAAQEESSVQEPANVPGQTHYIDPETKRAMPLPEDEIVPEISQTDAFMLGMQEGVPFAKDAEAATKALLDGGATFSESYSRNMDEINEAINEAEEKHPLTSFAGNVASGMAMPAISSYKAAMTYGALSGVSMSEDRDIWDAASGAGLGAFGLKIGKTISDKAVIVGKKLGLISDGTTKEILTREGSQKEVSAHIRKWYTNKDKNLIDGTADFAEDILNTKIGGRKLIEGNDTPETIYTKAKELVAVAGRQIDEAIESVDYKMTKVDTDDLYNELLESTGINKMLNAESPEIVKKGQQLLETLRSQFYMKTGNMIEVKKLVQGADGILTTVSESVPETVLKERTLAQMVKLKRDWAEMSSIKHLNGMAVPGSDNVEFWGNATKSLSKKMYDLAEGSGKLEKGVLRQLNKNFANADLVARNTKELSDKLKGGIMAKLQDLMKYKSMVFTASMLSSTAGATGGGGAVTTTIAATAAMLTGLAQDPRSPQKFAIGLRQLANNLQNPNYAKYLQKLSVASMVNADAFRSKLSSVASQLYLDSNPMKRSVDSAIENSQEILNIMTDEMPEMTPVFRKALENNDKETIARVMEQLASLESAGSFIEGGRGFDGITFNPETKIKVAIEVEKMDISRRQKSELLKGLKLESDEAGVLPQVQPEPNRFLEMRTRDKRRPQY